MAYFRKVKGGLPYIVFRFNIYRTPTYFNMRKISTFLLLLMLSVVSSYADTIFSTTFSTADEFNAWTVVDANSDGATWIFNEEGTPSKVAYKYDYFNNGDDWLISPAITPAETGTLIVKYTFSGSMYGESMEVYSGKGGTVNDMTSKEAAYDNIKKDEQSGSFLVDAKAGEPFHIAFRATSTAYKDYLYLCSVSVETIANPVDIKVTDILSPATGNNLGQEPVKVAIKNDGRVDINKFDVAFAVDGKEIAKETVSEPLAAGATLEYTFNAKADLSTPLTTYSIKAWATHPDDFNHANDTCYTSVRHKAPLNAPYTMGFEASENTQDFTFYNLNNDDGTWDVSIESGFFNMARTGNGCLAYGYDSNNSGDDWAMLDPINVEPGYYVLKFWYSNLDSYPEKMAVYWGNEAKPEAMTNKIVEFNPIMNNKYAESVNVVHFDKAQTIYFGFYAFSDKNQNLILVDDVSFEKVEGNINDLAVSDLQSPYDFVRESNLKDVIFNLANSGVTDLDADIKVSIDDVAVKDSTIAMKAQSATTVTFSNLLADLSDGNHKLKVEVVNDNDENTGNNVLTKDFTVISKPAKFWNFEDGKLPSDFTFRAEDNGTVDPSAGDEFNADGWGLFNIVNHNVLGEYLLAGTSWLDGTDQADRWLILPKVSIKGTDSYFVWDAYSYNPQFPEDYQIMVSATDDNSASYTEVLNIEGETPAMKTRGISLADYAGKDIYIAIRLRTKGGDCLLLDNIGIYTGSTQTGVTAITGTDESIIITDSEVRAAEGTRSIVISDAAGRTAKAVNGNVVSISSLQKGIYIATVKAADGTARSYKFMKK